MKSFKLFKDLSKAAYAYLNEQQQFCESEYLLGKHGEWYYDQETGIITFSNKGKVYLSINYESVGSISETSNTWLWSWANGSTWPNISTEILAVKDYGNMHNYEKLIEAKWDADIYDGWEMTAISAYLLNAKGAYRVPHSEGNLFSFKIFKKVTIVDEAAFKEFKENFV